MAIALGSLYVAPVEALADAPKEGYRYGALSASETGALRRGFRLPLDALFSSTSRSDLSSAIVLEPLPNPNQPLLAVDAAPGQSGDPFQEARAGGVLGALGELFGIDPARDSAADVSGVGPDPFSTEEDDPFAAGPEEDPFVGSTTPSASDASPASDDQPIDDDPFADF